MQQENMEHVELLPKAVKEYFLESIDERLHEHANKHLHAIEVAAKALLKHHLNFEMDRIEAQMGDNPDKEEERLSIIYASCHDFGLAKRNFASEEKELIKMNPETSMQVVLHIEDNIDQIIAEMVKKKQLEIIGNNPFRSSSSSPKHIH